MDGHAGRSRLRLRLPPARVGGSLRLCRRAEEVRAGLRRRLEQSDEPRSLRSCVGADVSTKAATAVQCLDACAAALRHRVAANEEASVYPAPIPRAAAIRGWCQTIGAKRIFPPGFIVAGMSVHTLTKKTCIHC